MQRILILRGTSASGVSLRPGEIAKVSAEDARILISLGKARPYVAPAFPEIEQELAEAMPDDGLTTESAAALVAKPRKKGKA